MAIPCEMLLHPEFLNNQQLIHIIQQRQLRIPNLESMPRDELLELFHNFCVPYGQRKYRDSGRGKILNKTRPMSPEPAKNHNLMNNQGKILCRTSSDRIKPPPDLLSGHMKRIKLDNKISLSKPVQHIDNSNKRKISMETSPIQESPPKKDRKLITWP